MAAGGASRRRVAYFYDEEMGNFHYGDGHPMKPHRVRMTHSLIQAYGLYPMMDVYRPPIVEPAEFTRFHTDDYVDFLRCISPDNMHEYLLDLRRYAVGEDCPVFEGMWDFIHLSTSASMGAAASLAAGDADLAINWSGGFHHAKRSQASGFCYVNDIVLAILELLKTYRRVLYVDIDIHHGDGVEEAFYTTDRVLCVSLHKYGDFFPGTGHWRDIGYGAGANTSINVPLHDGMDDASYERVFRTIVGEVMARYQPEAVVLQCGADSLAGDRLGVFNLSIQGHADCVRYVKSFGLPTLVLGGGGYTMRNVARAWVSETAVALDTPLDPKIPPCDYLEYFAPTYDLAIPVTSAENKNTAAYLDSITTKLLSVIRELTPVPGVSLSTGAISTGDGALAPRADPSPRARAEQRLVEDEHDDAAASAGGGGRRPAHRHQHAAEFSDDAPAPAPPRRRAMDADDDLGAPEPARAGDDAE